ncbi:MAG: glycosyltransferase family 39 protein [Candidatus Omnitrophica bacterium]|nr:glycosyltransferase family 39 protein [Candidatus Omnitrophota bacterium]
MKDRYIILLLIFIFLGISINGIYWGLPSSKLNELYFTKKDSIQKFSNENKPEIPRSFYNPIRSYHPDEYFIIKTLQSIKPPFFKFSIEQFSIGGFYLYLYGLLLLSLSITGFVHLSRDILYYFINPEEIAKFYITGRLISLIYGIGIVLLTYIITKCLSKNKVSAFLSAIILTFSPIFLMNTHYMYVDIPGTFWIMLTIYFALRYLDGEKKGPVLMGLSAGIAAGHKITFLLAFFVSFVAFLIENKSIREKMKNIVYSFLSFIGVIIITYPFIFTSIRHLFLGEGQNATQIVFSPYFYITSLRYGLGLPLLVFLLLGIVFTLYKRQDKSRIVVILWIVFFFLTISFPSLKFARYILPVLPPFIIIGTTGWFSVKNKAILFIRSVAIILILTFTFIYGMAFEMLFIKENIRTEAGMWIKENIPAGSSIGVTEVPWQFQMPPFDYYTYRVEVIEYNIEELQKKKPEYFILSSFQAPIPPYPIRLQEERINFYNEFVKSGMYKVEKKFEKYPSLGFITFRFKTLPEDLIYLNPSIVVYRKISYNNSLP